MDGLQNHKDPIRKLIRDIEILRKFLLEEGAALKLNIIFHEEKFKKHRKKFEESLAQYPQGLSTKTILHTNELRG